MAERSGFRSIFHIGNHFQIITKARCPCAPMPRTLSPCGELVPLSIPWNAEFPGLPLWSCLHLSKQPRSLEGAVVENDFECAISVSSRMDLYLNCIGAVQRLSKHLCFRRERTAEMPAGGRKHSIVLLPLTGKSNGRQSFHDNLQMSCTNQERCWKPTL